MKYLTCFVCTFVFSAVCAKQDVEDEVGGMPSEWVFNPPCEDPFPPMDADLHCGLHLTMPDTFICKASCRQGFQYPNGNFVLKHYCNLTTLKWSPEFEFPDCVELCTPFCENNGTCADGNICICPPSFRGDRCQFSTSVCDPKEALSPSAAWECSHTLHQTSCTLTCPENTEYEFQPESVYECTLDGVWTPEIAPKCQPINIIQPDNQGGLFPTPPVKVLQLPETGTCVTWSRLHYRTFDGAFYHFQGTCTYVLTKDCIDNTFSIHVTHGALYEITIYVGSDPYTLKPLNGVPIVIFKDEPFTVPTSIQGLVFEKVSDYVSISSSLGFRLKWNEEHITIEVNSQLRNKTCGLCGKFDGMVANDFELVDGTLTANVETFVNSWTMEDFFANKCEEGAIVKQLCSDIGDDRIRKATAACDILLDPKFSVCHTLVNPEPYVKACKLDYCICINPEEPCICDSLLEYFQECIRRGGKLDGGWRTDELCPLICPGDMTYEDCGTSCPKTCKGTVYGCEDNHCVDGCHCPSGTVLHNGRCLSQDDCPCIHREKEYQNGERYEQDCNACECHMGKWTCTNKKCEAQCSSLGDPHYTTFDGTKFEYLATCPVYLVYHTNLTILQETVPCSQLAESAEVEGISSSRFCTKSITVMYDTSKLVLKRGTYPSFNAKDVLSMPFTENGINVYEASSLITKVELPNDLSLMWDGKDRIYIDAPATLFGQTKGLCGTFNHNQKDDFTTPDGDLEADVIAFASRWQASDSCHKRSRRSGVNSCQLHPQSLREAEKFCSLLKSELFAECHSEIDPESFYKLCVTDLCSCQQKLQECICPIFADYSSSCSKKGVILNWTEEIDSCSLKCDSGKIYRECSNPCQSSCSIIASAEHCKESCVQGCACPEGTTLNADSECIPIHECPCIYEGKEFSAESKSAQNGNICTCENALWNCHSASLQELANMDVMINDQSTISCSSDHHMEIKSCVEKCPVTCKNMHLVQSCDTKICQLGCSCMEGYVLDEDTGKCVQTSECGCQHGNRKYLEGQTIKKECNLCICRSGTWQCSEKICPEQCTAWGDSHYKTFDGLIYDFHGDCDYVLSKGKHKGKSFTVSLRNIPCRGSAQTCSKSFTIDLNIKGSQSKLVLERESDLPKNAHGSPFIILEAGLFVLVYTNIGVSLRWDKGTRIYLTLDPHWRFKVTGLCGNFNDDQSDDFQTPSGGMPEIQPVVFANSWKIRDSCPSSKPSFDTCALHSNRQTWANQKCSILKSSLFLPCHSAVTLEPYYERCISDTCSCNEGGDCECLCTAIAAYAHECNNQGVHIKWRTQELCPIQCEECTTYDSCMPSCPIKTCENQHLHKDAEDACATDICVEGCNPKPCPLGEIYNNGREYKCIPESECIVPCLEINGRMYNEGERINDPSIGDSCQSCHCIRGTAVCTGMPCPTTSPSPRISTAPTCKITGWTPWFNTPPSVGGDFEVLENPLIIKRLSYYCSTWNVTKIECRDVESKRLHKDVGQNVLCSIPFGLICKDNEQEESVCKDYEIRMFCNCGGKEITITEPPTTTLIPIIPVEKCTEGWTSWMSAHIPESSGELESYELLRRRYSFCSKREIQTLECRSKQAWENPILDGGSADVECSIENGFRCTHSEDHICEDYEIRFYCKCAEETHPCVPGWTTFYNIDSPERNPEHGDEETIEEIRKLYPLCVQGEIEDIQCKAFLNDEIVDYTESGQFGLKCSKNLGFLCNSYLQARGQRCFDYAVRFYCSCVPTSPIPSKTPPTTLPPTSSTTLSSTTKFITPFQPENLECWTKWMNVHNPSAGGGDFETIAFIRKTFNFCMNPTKIECRTVGDHKTPLEIGQNLECSLENGLSCWNADNGLEGCQDYEIRFYCPCGAIPPWSTTFPTTTNPCPPDQIYDDCAYRCKQNCMSFSYQLSLGNDKSCRSGNDCFPGCRPIEGCKPPFRWSDRNICVPVDECMCIYEKDGKTEILSPNNVVRLDCKKCQCVNNRLVCYDEPGCGTTAESTPPVSRTTAPTSTTRSVPTTKMPTCWTDWINTHNPESGGGDFETIYFIRSAYDFCLNPVKIECRTVGDHKKASEIGQQLDCDVVNGLNCWNAENGLDGCRDYEVRFYCPCETITTITTTEPTTTTTKLPLREPAPCVDGWTEWYNSLEPNYLGESETVQSARANGGYFCSDDKISAIQCRKKDDLNMAPLQRGVTCDLLLGLRCFNADIRGGDSCLDYEVRFYCDCPKKSTPPPQKPPTMPEPIPSTTTERPTTERCGYWSKWINERHPSKASGVKGVKGRAKYMDDVEKKMLFQLQEDKKFCLEGFLSGIECRDAERDIDYHESGDSKLVCSVAGGLKCRGRDQRGGVCRDYMIRYYCSCKTSVPPRPPIGTMTVPPCTTYYQMVDGPFPLPDGSLKASSSYNVASTPQNARLSTKESQESVGAWIASESDSDQYLEIDLGEVLPVYGVITKGRDGGNEWVKSYSILYSRDGMSYVYVMEPERQKEKIFSGNFDSSTPVEHIFARPFEAQFIRIVPLMYMVEIALRADVLGCGEAPSFTPITTTMPTQPPRICMDKMGLENGSMADDQIHFSSARDELAATSRVRLNVKQVDSQPGAWVSDILDRNQFVTINFFSPRTVTGVIIQGRDLVLQWVTAFTISYSSDGITYNYILDKGKPKVFAGNFDSDTPVRVLFPQPLRVTYIRVNPVEWNNWISMRLEILGCFERYEPIKNYNITTTTPVSFPEYCADSMGFEDRSLPDYSIKVSSVALPWSGASRIRLNTRADENGSGAWVPKTSDYKPVVLIDFHGIRDLTGIITQGRQDGNMWIMTYRVEYSLDNVTWNFCVDRQTHQIVFPGNHDRNTPEIRIFENMVLARFIRITLIDYHTAPALRLELIGCFEPYGQTEPTVPSVSTTTDRCIEYGAWLSMSHSNHIFGDEEPIDKIIEFTGLCKHPLSIQCREVITRQDYSLTGQNVICNLERGLYCNNLEQRSGSCMNYEVRIGCWACEVSSIEPTPRPPPVFICPEVPKTLLQKCPPSCPEGSSCDGNSCVQTIDCPCFREGKKFMPGDIVITSDCQKCECILKGYSKCKAMVCPPCEKNQWPEMSKSCQCECKECEFGTVLCPTSRECIDEEKWCDGIVDCPDDETKCPTKLSTTTTTTTIAPPPVCSLDIPSETSVCEMNVNTFITFDGAKYQYEICDHVLVKEKSSEAFAINVHKICNESNTYQCKRAIKIHFDNWEIEMGPDNGDLYFNKYRIRMSNLELLSRRYKDFYVRKRGNYLVFRSEKYSFEVSIDSKQNVKLTVSNCYLQQMVGLCGFFNNIAEDDFTKPSGLLSSGSSEFGNSWSIGDLQRCAPPKCSPEILEKSIKLCQEFHQEPFANCSDYFDLELHVEACISYICECSLQSRNKDVLEKCKCDAFESFVDVCEEKRNFPLNDWRIKHDCAPNCEPGLEYNECGPGCDLTCDNYYEIETVCEEKCVPGCYCPLGLVHHNGHCVKPKLCQDCVCRGHGDPNYISFDGRYYAFQGNCTYVLAQHQSGNEVLDFQVLATNVECPEEPGTTCTEGIKVIWKGHVIEKFNGKQIKVDGVTLKAQDSPYNISGISVTFIPNKSTLIHIKEINLAVRYFDRLYGFNVELPSYLYINKTEGLCGVCNFDVMDDLYHRDGFITDDIKDFAYSWLVDNVKENCILPRIPVPSPPPYICNFTENPCNMFIDPSLYSKSCQNDLSYSRNPDASICRSKFQYAQQCCERGIALEAWLQESGCLTTCPENMIFQCTSACQETCDTPERDVCDLMPLYTCTCPPDQVFKNGSCVDPKFCQTCEGGYTIGETWNVGPCQVCECMDTLTPRCLIKDCSGPPLCEAGEELQVSPTKPDECCTYYRCKPKSRSDCGNRSIPECEYGMAAILYKDEYDCPLYKCECNRELCQPMSRPISTEQGEEYKLDDGGCCPQFRSFCIQENCSPPLDCDVGFKRVMFQGKCCKIYNCVPKNNVCIYRHKYNIVNGTEIHLPEEKYHDTEYEAGESWHDGLCRKCLCVEKGGQFAYHCQIEICLESSKYSDADSYVREPEFIPGTCCPKYHRVHCISEGHIYSVGEEWASPNGDKCKTFRCVDGPHGEVMILERSTICDISCPAYAVYVEAKPNSPKCCGHCKPVACEEAGVVREPGSKWKSISKPCFMAECIVRENSTLITLTGKSCPMLPSSCPKEHIVPDDEGCCPYCDIPADTCNPVKIPSSETFNYFHLKHNTHGYCSNIKPIYNLTKCSGQCESGSIFSAPFDNFESSCKCCLPLNAEKRSIVLDCEDGSKITKLYQQPRSCECSSCGQDRGTIELPPPY